MPIMRPMIPVTAFFRQPWVWALLILIPVTVFSGPDITVSGWFFDSAGHLFPGREYALPEWVRKRWPYGMFALAAGMALVGFWGIITRRPRCGLTPAVTAYLLLSLALGPGLVVNVVLKDHWGRPRPWTIAEFNGPNTYIPPGIPGGPCDKNCSFPSGHAALAFWAVAPAALAPARRRRSAVAAALVYGLIIGAARIIQGGHFLSDVLYSGVLVCAVTHILYRWLIAPATPGVTEI